MDKMIRETVAGKVSGLIDYNGTLSWKGVPYAAPPVGRLRWRAPREPIPWDGVREAHEFEPFAAQFFSLPDFTRTNHVVGDEDCLYLNVWRPDTEEKDLPVYFWIHGGSNNTGRSNDYSGANLALTANMVVVTINYRLGPFGWFNHPALKTGDPLDDSGNYGLLDAIMALKWVQANITGFGGDPGRVTVAGESAGGQDTLALLICPLAEGLFHGAISQSGVTHTPTPEEGRIRVEQNITRLLVRDGVPADTVEKSQARMTDENISEYLRSKNTTEIMISQLDKAGVIAGYGSFIDGTVIPGPVLEMFTSGKFNRMPMILGANLDEWKFFAPLIPPFMPGQKDYTILKDALWGEKDLEEVLPGNEAKKEYDNVCFTASRVWMLIGADSIARAARMHQDDVYAYHFKWGNRGTATPEYESVLGAAHSMEISFFFGNEPGTWISPITEENIKGRESLSRDMQHYLASFAAEGNPNGNKTDGLPEWERWSNEKGGVKAMSLDADLVSSKIGMETEEITIASIKEDLKRMKPENAALAEIQAGIFFTGWDEI